MRTYDFSAVRALVVDDHPYARQLFGGLLDTLGFRTVNRARDGREALDILGRFPIDLALINWPMELVAGTELARHIRLSATSPNPFLPIILLTAYTEFEWVKAARDMGVNEILVKPVSPQTLIQRFVQVIDHPRQFIRSADFFGPDRRRRNDPDYKGPERRRARQSANTTAASAGDLIFVA